jgi:hypothetical protein
MWESLLTILNSQNSKGISTLYLQYREALFGEEIVVAFTVGYIH